MSQIKIQFFLLALVFVLILSFTLTHKPGGQTCLLKRNPSSRNYLVKEIICFCVVL